MMDHNRNRNKVYPDQKDGPSRDKSSTVPDEAPPGSYYYDDSTGYEVYDADEDGESDEEASSKQSGAYVHERLPDV